MHSLNLFNTVCLRYVDESDQSFGISDQFLIGTKILVAPILEPSISARNVYFPNIGSSWQRISETGELLDEFYEPGTKIYQMEGEIFIFKSVEGK